MRNGPLKAFGISALVTFVGAVVAAVGAFGSPLVGFLGGCVAAAGAIWSAKEQNDLGEQLFRKNEELARLAQETAYSVTGGPTVCYLTPMGGTPETGSVIVHGDYPLYNLSARIVDLDLTERRRAEQPNRRPVMGEDPEIRIGDMPPRAATVIGPVFQFHGEYRRWNIFFSARNGFFTQLLRVRKINGEWQPAIRVMRRDGREVAFEKIPEGFPREPDGSVKWD